MVPGDSEFQRFVQRRAVLNERLEAARVAIDQWIAENDREPSMSQLAHLEGLLKVRRDLLEELIRLDDSFMGHLLRLRQGEAGSQ